MSNAHAKLIYNAITSLKSIGPRSDAKTKFIVDTTPFDNEDGPSPTGDLIITGRLLPRSTIYKEGAIQIEIRLGADFPMKPPKVYLKTQVYHPNVSKEGEVCIDHLSPAGSWTPTTTLVAVIEEITKVIDQPSLDRIQYAEAAILYDTNRQEYERKAAEIFNQQVDESSLPDVQCDSAVILFSVNCEISSLINLELNIVQLTTCATDDDLNLAVSQLKRQRTFMVVSSKQPSVELLSCTQLIRYYCLAVPEEKSGPKSSNDLKIIYIDTIDDLAGELYHDLGEYYRQEAQRTITSKQDRMGAKRLLAKSKRCYEKLEQETEKTLSYYADILISQGGEIHESFDLKFSSSGDSDKKTT